MSNPQIIQALEFKDSPRGTLIMAQALYCGIKYLEQTEGVMREVSNIADMQYLLDNIYGHMSPALWDE